MCLFLLYIYVNSYLHTALSRAAAAHEISCRGRTVVIFAHVHKPIQIFSCVEMRENVRLTLLVLYRDFSSSPSPPRLMG